MEAPQTNHGSPKTPPLQAPSAYISGQQTPTASMVEASTARATADFGSCRSHLSIADARSAIRGIFGAIMVWTGFAVTSWSAAAAAEVAALMGHAYHHRIASAVRRPVHRHRRLTHMPNRGRCSCTCLCADQHAHSLSAISPEVAGQALNPVLRRPPCDSVPLAGGGRMAVERHRTTGYVPGGAPLGRLARVRA